MLTKTTYQLQPDTTLRGPNVFGNDTKAPAVSNNSGKYTNNGSNISSSLSHIGNNVGHNDRNNNSGHIHDSSSASRVMSQQSPNGLSNGMSNMHIHQNPAIASPSMGSIRGGLGDSANSSSNGALTSQAITQSVDESLNDPQLAGHPSAWSIEQVAYWLRWCGFGSVAPSFVENEISGAILLELNLNNLKELDINSFGKRFNIMNAITSLKQYTKAELGNKGSFGALSAGSSMYGTTPNIPPRMTSAPISGPSPRASYDSRGDYMRDPRQDLHDPRTAPAPPTSVQSQNTRIQQQPQSQQQLPMQTPQIQTPQQQQPQQFSDYDIHPNHLQGRTAVLARSDTLGSMMSGGGGSMGEYGGQLNDARGGQRQSVTSAYSSNSNPLRSQWDRNAGRAPQMPSPAGTQARAPLPSDFDDAGYGGRLVDQQYQQQQQQPSSDQYPRPMNRSVPMSPEMLNPDSYSPTSFEQPIPKQRKYHNPDTANRPQNGKADPSDKVVSLDLIGKPDYAGWLKKRGDTYRTWKSRWFMLKGVTLYYMNSPKDNASKDYINLIGYKIIQDENIYAGKYCFKAVHEELRNFYFYTESESDMKGWLKALMKVTIGRDPTAPVISSSNIPTIPLHVARKLAPRPPSPSKRNRALGPNGQPMHPQQQPQQQQQQQLYEQKPPFQQQHLPQQQPQQHTPQQQQKPFQQQQTPQQQQQKAFQQQLLDYDDQDSDGEDYLANEYGNQRPNYGARPNNMNSNSNGNKVNGASNGLSRGDEPSESPILQSLSIAPQQRHSFVHSDQRDGDDDPWRDEDDEGFGTGSSRKNNSSNQQQQEQQQQQQQQHLKNLRPDSELDSFHQHREEEQSRQGSSNGHWTQEQYVSWLNRNLPSSVDPVSDITQSLRSGVVLVRLIEQLSGEQVDKRIPNATYTLQMLENLLTAFKFMDRVGISTDGYTVKDIFNGNEDRIIMMFEAIRARFPEKASASAPSSNNNGATSISSPPLPPLPMEPAPSTPVLSNKGSPRPNNIGSPAVSHNRSPLIGSRSATFGSQPLQLLQLQHTDGSEYEALYDEAARSTIS
ncbi:hypothetical protein BC939DRAFT_173958 [Gamsiella multidivaricata]|uniref:uncharacterized protein n=1 Tax=Gamsiella multidivaricata TaxID=101098 RepID=UPI00221F55BC|nr:uncharacterized protein BC939DRAFT_173958 [Gamsiella multidivaricata]KAI7822934.1 hypothetical protein BC939DRAFT_173958 [Gamsiella multidivaricata]